MTDDDYYRNAVDESARDAAFSSIAMLGMIGVLLIIIGVLAIA